MRLIAIIRRVSSPMLTQNQAKCVKCTSRKLCTPPGEQHGGPANVSDVKFEVLPTPRKSKRDKKEYKVIRLENGLTACLISDMADVLVAEEQVVEDTQPEESVPELAIQEYEVEDFDEFPVEDEEPEEEDKDQPEAKQKMAAAALTVSVGSFSDPSEVPGLAHFLEHMVFMGSEKFPRENDFDTFITQKGGSNNACTDVETTTFHFQCLERYLYKSLDKFAQFFISPLMKKSSMQREREAIESEFQMALPNDAFRKEQLLMGMFNEDCSVNTFTWGNLATLKTDISDDILYETLHEFRKRHYSGHRMTLCIQARLPIETLQTYVLDCFKEVHLNELPPIDFSENSDDIYLGPHFNKMYYIKPIRNIVQLDLTWWLPSMLHLYKCKPHQYVSWVMGDEGKGSLMSYLRKKVWALAIYTGNGESGSEHNSMYAHFSATVVLTQQGLKHIKDVITAIFSYIHLLRKVGPQERIYKEIQTIAENAFIYADEKVAAEMVESVAESMQYYPSEDYLTGGELYFDYCPDEIDKVVGYLRTDNLNIMIMDADMPDTIDRNKVEPWFKTRYAVQDIPAEWVKEWTEVEPFEEFQLPGPNPFLTTDFTLLPKSKMHPSFPVKLIDTDMVELWHRTDQKFDTPTACYNFNLISPMVIEGPLNACMLDMYITFLALQMSEEGYPALVSELDYSFGTGDKGLVFGLGGYNQKLPVLLELVCKSIKNVAVNLEESIFDAVKEAQTMTYYNRFNKPIILNQDVRLSLLLNAYWTPIDRFGAIKRITFDDMVTFAKDLTKNVYMQVLIQGNVAPQIAINSTEKFIKKLGYDKLLPNTFPKIRVVQLPTDEHCCRIVSFNLKDSNSIVTNYYQAGPFNIKTSSVIEMMMMIVDEPLFNMLRTKEQLGYTVFASSRHTFGILGYSITVNTQAGKHTTGYVDQRIEAFIRHIRKLLKRMPEKKLSASKRDLIKLKHVEDTLLREEVSRNWGEICSREYIFDRLAREIKAIEELKLKDLRQFWDEYNVRAGKVTFRKLSIQVIGHCSKESMFTEDGEEKCLHIRPKAAKGGLYELNLIKELREWGEYPRGYYYITDIEIFKQHLYLYPSWTSLKIILPFKQQAQPGGQSKKNVKKSF